MKKASSSKTAEVAERARDSIAASEVSLYHNVVRIREAHDLEGLGIAFYDYETTIGWSYNADTYFHAASTMKTPVLLEVLRRAGLVRSMDEGRRRRHYRESAALAPLLVWLGR